MNRGFAYYFNQAMKSSATTIWKNKNFFRVIAFWFMELIGRVCLLGAVFDLASVRQAKIAHESRRMDIPKCFSVASRANSVWTMVFAIVLEALIVLAGMIVIAILAGLLVLLGYVVSLFVVSVDMELFLIIFSVPGAILELTFLFLIALTFAPTPYVIESNPGISAGDAVSVCVRTMRLRGKATLFATIFVITLIEGAILSALSSIVVVTARLTAFLPYASAINIAVTIICLIGFFFTIPMFSLGRKITLNGLFGDIVLDPDYAVKNTKGITVKNFKTLPIDPAKIDAALPTLFDETANDAIPLATSKVRAKREEEARIAARRAEYERKRAEREAQMAARAQEREAQIAAREQERAQKEAEKEQEREAQRTEREAQMAAREQERAQREAEKEQEREAQRAEREAQIAAREQERAQKEAEKEQEREAQMAAREQERAQREAERAAAKARDEEIISKPKGTANSENREDPIILEEVAGTDYTDFTDFTNADAPHDQPPAVELQENDDEEEDDY